MQKFHQIQDAGPLDGCDGENPWDFLLSLAAVRWATHHFETL